MVDQPSRVTAAEKHKLAVPFDGGIRVAKSRADLATEDVLFEGHTARLN